jgi:hypothetical protein
VVFRGRGNVYKTSQQRRPNLEALASQQRRPNLEALPSRQRRPNLEALPNLKVLASQRRPDLVAYG